MNTVKSLSDIANNTQNDAIVIMIVLVIALLPLYVIMVKNQRANVKDKNASEEKRQKNYIEREALIVGVVRENSAVNSGLKTTLEIGNAATLAAISGLQTTIEKSNDTMVSALVRIHERIDELREDAK